MADYLRHIRVPHAGRCQRTPRRCGEDEVLPPFAAEGCSVPSYSRTSLRLFKNESEWRFRFGGRELTASAPRMANQRTDVTLISQQLIRKEHSSF
jgi:hypothetical protein